MFSYNIYVVRGYLEIVREKILHWPTPSADFLHFVVSFVELIVVVSRSGFCFSVIILIELAGA